jgi:hypothetical protein
MTDTMSRGHHCAICDQVFASKSAFQSHVQLECKLSVKLTDDEGFIMTVDKKDEKFGCPKCEKQYNRANHLLAHWKKCLMRPGNQSNTRRIKNADLMRGSQAGKHVGKVFAI